MQYHLHTPSEHLIAGKSFPLEIHFVHQAVNSKVKTDNIVTDEDPTPESVNEFLVIGMMLDEKPQVEGCDDEIPAPPPASLETERRRQLLIGPKWTYDKSTEMPAGEKDMGTFKIRIYTPEQQKRLGVDENGNPTGSATAPRDIIPPSVVPIKPQQKKACELLLKETGILRDDGFTLTNVPFNKFYQYQGSLTTYPYSPDVTWIFQAETPLESQEIIDLYSTKSGSAREIVQNVYPSEVFTFVNS